MVNRKFSDSEIRAFTKNRHEEKELKTRLQKLNVECGTYHDFTANQRKLLQAENTDICRTSGNSPITVNQRATRSAEFDISKRFRRPWVYSAMETTYNAKYREAEIPLPKRKVKHRSKSAATCTLRDFVSKSSSGIIVRSPILQRSKSCISKIKSTDNTSESTLLVNPTTTENNCDDINRLNPGDEKGFVHKKVASENSFPLGSKSSYEMSYPLILSGDSNTVNMDKNKSGLFEDPLSFLQLEKDKKLENFQLSELYNLEKRHDLSMPKLITLPKVYEIEIEASKGAFQRMMHRSRSRVSFSVPTSGVEDQQGMDYRTHPTNVNSDTGDRNEDENITVDRSGTSDTYDPEVVAVQNNSANSKCDGQPTESETSKSIFRKRNTIRRTLSTGAVNIPPKLSQDMQECRCEDVLYKGRKLRNYIRPEERYKLDPVIVRRGQLKMDRLAKESSTYLGRINHENISVDIAFPRTVRNRILQQLIDDNNSGKSQILCNPEEELLKTKVGQFLESISQYISKQQEN